jgi:Ferritin-like
VAEQLGAVRDVRRHHGLDSLESGWREHMDVLKKQRASRVKLLQDDRGVDTANRRAFLQRMVAQGVLIPAAYALSYADSVTAEAHRATEVASSPSTAQRARANTACKTGAARIVRDFADPYLELVRLLHEASEIEHSLMLQYLYGAFSLKPAYHSIAGYGNPNADDLLGVAIQEMQHLATVNRLLVAVGAAPYLVREDFPYEPEVYPFQFHLEPLSIRSLAKYVYCEAPVDATDPRHAKTPEDTAFHERLFMALGRDQRPNHVGSLYRSIIATVNEVQAAALPGLPDLKPWIEKLQEIMDQGEQDHYKFFRRVLMGTHKGFGGRPDVWALKPADPAYPALALAVNPSAYVGHLNQIRDPVALGLAWLGNLHYWTVLFLFDLGFRTGSTTYTALAKQHMVGPIWTLARHLPEYGVGLPFDPLCSGYAPGASDVGTLRIIERTLNEADEVTQKLRAHLPEEYPLSAARDSVAQLKAEIQRQSGRDAEARRLMAKITTG